ncbi:MAG TPA: SRPBCC family protein [Gammaproteobacteria bacterium]|nr:SRPBCC family protein [Gammaproteobacteria bacterium]|tara:strand:+ start:6336 stop:6725 length:390 start_codon:yes stop_codon:yes gene_type:complete
MAVKIEHSLPYPPAQIWQIVGDPGRVDWVPGVAGCDFDGEVRRFVMEGAGDLAERIVTRDEAQMLLEYSVVESTPPLASHLACIRLEHDDIGTKFIWTTEVEPTAVEPFIEQGMQASLAKLEEILDRSD